MHRVIDLVAVGDVDLHRERSGAVFGEVVRFLAGELTLAVQ